MIENLEGSIDRQKERQRMRFNKFLYFKKVMS